MKKIIIIFFYFLIFLNCTSQNTINEINNSNIGFSDQFVGSGRLIVKFISKESVFYENVDIKITRRFPETKYQMSWESYAPLPLLLPTGKETAEPTIHEPEVQKTLEYMEGNREYNFYIKEGEYYLALESERKEYKLIDQEEKSFLFQFGFTNIVKRMPKERVVTPYNSLCESETQNYLYKNFASCPKVKIIKNRTTLIQIGVSEAIPIPIRTRIAMVFGGIFFFPLRKRPFQMYFYRNMKDELLNPKVEENAE